MVARALTVLVLAIAVAHPASAQGRDRVEFAVTLGPFVPMRHLSTPSIAVEAICTKHPETPDCGGPDPSPRRMQAAAIAVGGRITSWMGDRGGLEEWLWYTPSGVSGFGQASGSVFIVGSRFVYSLAPHSPTTSLLVMAGPALMVRSALGTQAPAGTLAIGLDQHPRRAFRFRGTIEEYLSSVQGIFQNDVVLSLSISRSGRSGESNDSRQRTQREECH